MNLPFNQIFGTEHFIDVDDFVRLVARMLVDLACATLVIAGVHYRLHRNRELLFTYYVFNVITFTMCILLRKVPMELGFALGLFAVFGILRYRTEEIRMRDLTYMFISIGLGILNGVANKKVSTAELLFVDGTIIGLVALLEQLTAAQREGSLRISYDDLALLQPERQAELLEDLKKRTGLEVVRVEVQRVDLLRDSADVLVVHRVLAQSPRHDARK